MRGACTNENLDGSDLNLETIGANAVVSDFDDDSDNDALLLLTDRHLAQACVPNTVQQIPLDPNIPALKEVFYFHGLFDKPFLSLLDTLATCLPGSTESHNMFAIRRFFESELLAAAILDRLPHTLGLKRVLPSMRFIE